MSLISILIPAHNEELNLAYTIQRIQKKFNYHAVNYEIVIVNDNSTDKTPEMVLAWNQKDPRIRLVNNVPPFGIGNAIKRGLAEYKGDYVIIAMADASDSPQNMLQYVHTAQQGYDCCFGTRWAPKAKVIGYPSHKWLINRMANWFIQILFQIPYNDTTNAFKCYSRQAINGLQPLMSHHFNITVELPLKAITRGYSYATIPTNWYNRRKGRSNLKIKEMGSRYFFVILCIFLEKLLCKTDYAKKKNDPS